MQVFEVIGLDSTAWIEIGAAFFAYFVLSFLWWGPLFGKAWARQMGQEPDMAPTAREMAVPLALQVVASFLVVFVLWHVMMAFSVDLDTDDMANPGMGSALQGAFFTWLGFFVPVQLGRVAWEKASWTLFGINAGGQLVALLGAGAVFALL